MSRKRVGNKYKLAAKRGGKRKAFTVIGLILCLIIVSAALGQWKALRSASPTTVAQETSPAGSASLNPSSPSKEYIYAGSRLVATEEPTGSQQVPPSAPVGLTATAGNTQVSLSWSASAGATSYNVKRSTTSGGPYSPLASNVTTTSYLNTGLTNGITYYYVVSAVNTSGESANSSQASATPSAGATQLPFNGPHNIPGILQVEDFDTGGEGVAYHDTDPFNGWGEYRPSEGVDIVGTADVGGGFCVGNGWAGEWLEYTINVTTAQNYNLQARVASDGPGGTFHFEIDGVNKGSLTAPNTNNWGVYQTVTLSNISIASGPHVLRLSLDTNGTQQFPAIADFNYINIVASGSTAPPGTPTSLTATPSSGQVSLSWSAPAGATSYNVKRSTTNGGPYTTIAPNVSTTSYLNTGLTNGTTYYYVVSAVNAGGESSNSSQASATPSLRSPFNTPGTPWPVPGLIEVENFDNGGEGITYHDNEATNIGGAYRSTGVDISACVEGGYEVGWAYAGEWLEYTVNVAAAGTYTIQARVASDGPGGTFHVAFGGADKTGPMTVPNTGGWATYQTISKTNVSLSAGQQILRIVMDVNGSQFSGIPAIANFNYVNITASSGPPPVPTGLTATAGNAQVSLSWSTSAGAASYNVKRSTSSGGPYTTIAPNVPTTSYLNTGLTNGTTYYYVVSAVNAAGESANSTQASATPTSGPTPPPAPTGLIATAGNAQVSLSWSASAGATSYNVKRATTTGGPYTTIAPNVSTTNYLNTGLTNGTSYYYVVSAVNAAGEGANSTQASATPTGGGGGGTCTTVSLFSGNGTYGYVEGIASSAQWRMPIGGAVAKDPVSGFNSLFVADTENHRIRMLYLEGPNTGTSILIAGTGTAGYSEGGGDPLQALYNFPQSVSVVTDANGIVTELLIADTDNHSIRKLLQPLSGSAWRPVWFSGQPGVAGLVNGAAASSRYNFPKATILGLDGNFYATDSANGVIRKLTSQGNSSTLASTFSTPTGITVSKTSGLLYFTAEDGNSIWQVTTGGVGTKIAGGGADGFADGTGASAKFNHPCHLAWASTAGGEVLYIIDRKNYRIRKLVISTNAVTTFAGTGSTGGYLEGSCTAARFSQLRGVAVGPAGELYIMDSNNNRIRKTQ